MYDLPILTLFASWLSDGHASQFYYVVLVSKGGLNSLLGFSVSLYRIHDKSLLMVIGRVVVGLDKCI